MGKFSSRKSETVGHMESTVRNEKVMDASAEHFS